MGGYILPHVDIGYDIFRNPNRQIMESAVPAHKNTDGPADLERRREIRRIPFLNVRVYYVPDGRPSIYQLEPPIDRVIT